MNLQIAVVLSCTDTGCHVQPVDEQTTMETEYSKPIRRYNIPIRPNQFVIVDQDTVPPETIFRWSRGKVTRLKDHAVEVEMGDRRLPARRSRTLEVELEAGDEVVVAGFNDENRQVIDTVTNGIPSHAGRLRAEWFPEMKDARVRDHE